MPIIYSNGKARITIPAAESIAVYTEGVASVYRELGYPNVPPSISSLGQVSAGQTVFGAYASGATIIVEAGAARVFYSVGVSPIANPVLQTKVQAVPGTLNATGTLTAALMEAGIVTSTSAAAVAATLDTGAVMDAAVDFAIGDSFDWSLINTGPNTVTVTASTGHTIVGTATVVTVVSSRWRTKKTAADTFVTYRLS